MDTILQALKGVSGYPIPQATLSKVALRRGLDLTAEATADVLVSSNLQLAEADVMMWVSTAPNVKEGGVEFNLMVSDRESLRVQANAIYRELGDNAYQAESTVTYGYKGEDL